MARRSRRAKLALFGRTYLDVQVQLPLAALGDQKGKRDARVTLAPGGFACNAARALAGRFGPGEVRVVTVVPPSERARVRAHLSPSAHLDALRGKGTDPALPVSVILDPAGACRILRDPRDDDAQSWRLDRVPSAALAAPLLVCGRLPGTFVQALLAHARAQGSRTAWVGGAALAPRLLQGFDLLCLNVAEARRACGSLSGSPRQLALELARRAGGHETVRVVTGGARAPTAAAHRVGRKTTVLEVDPAPVDPERIVTLLGTGDAFAAHFLADACFDAQGGRRPGLDVPAGLKAASRAAADRLLGRDRSRTDRRGIAG